MGHEWGRIHQDPWILLPPPSSPPIKVGSFGGSARARRGGEGRGEVCVRACIPADSSRDCRIVAAKFIPLTRIHVEGGGGGGGEGAYTWKRGGGKGVRGPEPLPPSSFLHRNRLYDITPAGGEARDIRFMRPRRAFLYPSPSSSRKLCAIRGS